MHNRLQSPFLPPSAIKKWVNNTHISSSVIIVILVKNVLGPTALCSGKWFITPAKRSNFPTCSDALVIVGSGQDLIAAAIE